MAKKSTKSSKKQDAKDREKKAAAKAKAKAAARLAALVGDAKKARKTADKAAKAADKAEAKATAAGAPAPKEQPDRTELLRLALRSTEARLTDAERRVEQLQAQIAALHEVEEDSAEEALEDAIVDAAVAATVAEAIVDAEVVATTPAEEIEVVAVELDAAVAQAEPAPEEPSHEGDAAEAAAVFEGADAGAEPTVTTSELTPPLPEQPDAEEPNESWTLLRLRQAAKDRGLTGTSNLPKAALLQRLRG